MKVDFFSYEKRYTYYESKKALYIYLSTTFYSLFNMSSCRKPEIQNDLPKITKIKWICYFFNKPCFFHMFKQLINWILKIVKFKKKLRPQWDSNPQPPGFEATEHLRNRMRKKTAENVFKGHVGWRGWWVHVSDSKSVYVCQALARAPVKSSHCSIEQIYVTLFAQSFFSFSCT